MRFPHALREQSFLIVGMVVFWGLTGGVISNLVVVTIMMQLLTLVLVGFVSFTILKFLVRILLKILQWLQWYLGFQSPRKSKLGRFSDLLGDIRLLNDG